MHVEARAFVGYAVAAFGPFGRVVEFGSLNINGAIRELFGSADYLGIDPQPGPGVDLVADAATWEPNEKVECVVCCEVFEHTANWRSLVDSAARALKPRGLLIVTTAGPGREPHSAVDGGQIRSGEHYGNIDPADLVNALEGDFTEIHVEQLGLDVRATARRN